MTGTIHPKTAMFLRIDAGTAESEDGQKFELCYSPGGTPIIRSKQTGKSWSIGWKELVTIAIEAGIEEPDE